VAKVAVDAPGGMSPRAVECIGLALGHAAVPEFTGAPVTVGAGFYVP
jgi:hypothetical protein